MSDINFQNAQAKAIYDRVIGKTPSKSDKKTVKKIFEKQAQIDGKVSLSEAEAKQVEDVLNAYDKAIAFQIGVFNEKDVDIVYDETKKALKAQQLFNKTFKYNKNTNTLNVNNSYLKKLRSFIEDTAEDGHQHFKIIEIARRINPYLAKEDHLLIFQLEGTSNQEERGKILNKITKKIKLLTKNEMNSYDGKVSTYKSKALKRLNAFWYALDSALNGNEKEIDQFIGEYSFEITQEYSKYTKDKAFLTNTGGSVTDKAKLLSEVRKLVYYKSKGKEISYKKIKTRLFKNKDLLLSIIEDAVYKLGNASFGSQDKIKAYHRLRLLQDVALVCGISIPEIESRMHTSMLPGIDLKNEYGILSELSAAEYSPEKVDDYLLQEGILKNISRVTKKYTDIRSEYIKNPTLRKQISMSSTEILLMTYINYAILFGCDYDDIEDILEDEGIISGIPKRDSAVKADEVNKKGGVVASPKNIPEDVVKILEEIGVYDDICDDINMILFTKEIKDFSIRHEKGGEVLGQANSYCKSIWVDLIDAEGKRYSAGAIAETIIHEWLHIKWGNKNHDNPELMRSTPNERNSFLKTAEYMEVYLKKLIAESKPAIQRYNKMVKNYELSKDDKILDQIKNSKESKLFEEIYNIALQIYTSRSVGLAANTPLGYPIDDINSRSDLPKMSEEIDLDTYPANLTGSYSKILDKIISTSGLKGDEAKKTKDLYDKILEKEMYIFGIINIDKRKENILEQKVCLMAKNKIIMNIKDYFPPLVPLQSEFGLPKTGKVGLDAYYFTIYWNALMSDEMPGPYWKIDDNVVMYMIYVAGQREVLKNCNYPFD